MTRESKVAKISSTLESLLFAAPTNYSKTNTNKHAVIDQLRCFSPLYGLSTILEPKEESWFFAPGQITTPEILWPLRFSFCAWKDEDATRDPPESHLTLFTFQSVTSSALRGQVARFVPRMAIASAGILWPEQNKFLAARIPVGWVNGAWRKLGRTNQSWETRETREAAHQEDDSQLDIQCKLATSLALTRRYEWCVSFSIDNSPALMLPTDPTGLKVLFKDREKEPDKDRRTALRHWVSSHWRQKRTDPEAESFVRQHLRGRVPFRWRGIDCVVEPAPYDIELNEKLARERG